MTPFLDLALVNGRVRTLDQSLPFASAIGLRGDRIAVIGDDADVRAQLGPATEVIDLKGATAFPGIIDCHVHPLAVDARGVELAGARTLSEVRDRIAEHRRSCEPGSWLIGFGLDHNVFSDTSISGHLLEDAADGAPALFTFEDFHTAVVTPRALELAGIDGPRSFPEHAEIVVNDAGVPTGELRETSAMQLVHQAMPPLTSIERYEIHLDRLRRFASVGLTGVHGMDGSLETIRILSELEANGDLITRMVMPFWVQPDTPEEMWEAFAEHRDARGERWRMGVAKFFIDGVVDTGTAWLFEPDSEGAGMDPFWPEFDRYVRAVDFFVSRGFQVVTHAVGDRAVHEVLNTYRKTGAAPGIRHRIEHLQIVKPDDLPRFANEGVVASMQAQHMMWLEPDRSDAWSRRLGADRCSAIFQISDLFASGAVVALGSDFPVASYDWREGMAATQLRRPPGHPERAPYDDRGVDALTALHGYTSQAAVTTGDADRLGALKVGALADITVTEVDPVAISPDDLLDDPVVLTIVGGDVVHRGPTVDV